MIPAQMSAPQPNIGLLTIAREWHGFTQAELARRLSVAQGTISKVENRLMPPSEALVQMYADALGFPVSFFYQEHQPRNLPLTLYRKRVRVALKELRAIQSKLNILLLHIKKLLKSVSVPENRIPRISIENEDAKADRAREIAQELRIQWHLATGPIGNLTKMLESVGVVIASCDFGTRLVDGLSFYDPHDPDQLPPVIMVSSEISGDRLRFTLAHELGHILLHHHLPMVPGDCEEEADSFAGEFLVPRAAIRGFLKNTSLEKLASLKGYWKVSMASLLRKAGELGCITDRQKSFLWMKMGKFGYRAREPVPIPRDEPALITDMLRYHTDKLRYSDQQLVDLLATTQNRLFADYPALNRGLRVVT